MIAKLTGIISDIGLTYTTIDVGGVGYAVFTTEKWKGTATVGNTETLLISTQVKEDAIELYGFANSNERKVFELLLTVSGVGPRTGLAIISYGVSDIERAISQADVEFFTSIPRIGKKNAQKIIIELKNKMGGMTDLDLRDESSSKKQEIIDALTSMGFSKIEILNGLKTEYNEQDTLEVNIKRVLKWVGSKK